MGGILDPPALIEAPPAQLMGIRAWYRFHLQDATA